MESPLLLDTHYWIWLQFGTPGRLTPHVLALIQDAAERGNLFVSVISVWEVGLLESKKRLHLQMDCTRWVDQALATPGLSTAPLTPAIALESTRLPGSFRGDPADRIIVSTARAMGAKILTCDTKMHAYGRQRHVQIA